MSFDEKRSSKVNLAHLSLRLPDLVPQQHLGIRMHAAQLLGDRVLRPVFLLRQPLDLPDLGEKLADLLRYVLAILLNHQSCSSVRSFNAVAFYLFR